MEEQIPDLAKDVRLNLTSMMADETLSPQSKYGLLLASAIATRNAIVTTAMETAAGVVMTPEAAKSAASVMAMNSAYYRFVHLVSKPEYKTMAGAPVHELAWKSARGQKRFRIEALAVSAINRCGACMDAHEKALRQSDVGSDTIQVAVRFAAIVPSVAVAIEATAGLAHHNRRSNPHSPHPSFRPSRDRLGWKSISMS